MSGRPQMKTPELTEVNPSALDRPEFARSFRGEEAPALLIVGRVQ